MGCPHRSHFVKTASIGPTPLSVSGAVLEYSLRLLSQFLICAPSLPYRRDRLAHPAQPRPGLPGPAPAAPPPQPPPAAAPRAARRRAPASPAPPSPTSRISLLPMITPSASAAASAAAADDPMPNPSAPRTSVSPPTLRTRPRSPLRRPDAEPERHRNIRLRPDPPQQLHGLRRQAVAHPRNPGHRDAVDETRRQRHGPPYALLRRS